MSMTGGGVFGSVRFRRGLRFAATGLLITLIHVTIVVLMVELFGSSPSAANGVAFTVSGLISYVINTLWSFSARLRGYTLFRFLCVSLVGLCVSILIARFGLQAGYDYRASTAIVVLVVPIMTFLLHSKWTYR